MSRRVNTSDINVAPNAKGLIVSIARFLGKIWRLGLTKEEVAWMKGKSFDELFVVNRTVVGGRTLRTIPLDDFDVTIVQTAEDLICQYGTQLVFLVDTWCWAFAWRFAGLFKDIGATLTTFFRTILLALIRVVLGSAHLSRSVRFANADFFVPNARVEAIALR